MDKRTQFSRLKKMIDEYSSDKISFDVLQGLIMTKIATTPKLIDNAIRTLGITGLIKDIGDSQFQIIK